MAMTVFVGTSGWQYRHWRGVWYPDGLRQADWLAHYAEHFQTVEVNATFYWLPERAVFATWAERTPADFILAVKFSRYLTHMKRLRTPAEPVERFFARAGALGAKLGPVLVQLPPNFHADVERLRDALAAFPAGVRVAVELRHPSWFTDEVRAVLADHNAALCWADRSSRLLTPTWRTAGWLFVRFHAGLGPPQPCYSAEPLQRRARLLAEHPKQDAFVFFNNDAHGCAVRDAGLFAQACRDQGLSVSRVPAPQDVLIEGWNKRRA
jgi:uncharacterized protein YecE (DUF72 family)